MKVLIIGATGATGQILMREALEQGHEVTALARDPSAVAPEDPRLRVLQGNALDVSSVEAAMLGEVIDDRKLRFDVEVTQGDRTIGVGTHERRVIEDASLQQLK